MKKLIAFSLLAIATTAANADAAWLQYSIASPGDLLLPWNRPDVYGLRLNMPYGENKGSVYGVDLGFVGVSDGDVIGLAVTCANVADMGATEGLHIGFVANRTKEVYGVQLAGALNWNEDVAYGCRSAQSTMTVSSTGCRSAASTGSSVMPTARPSARSCCRTTRSPASPRRASTTRCTR
jgi:hypothetical protein